MFGMQMGKMGGVGQMTLAQRIAYMFANSEPGAWYDPSDMSTLFQDAAGTTPVTAVEQPVGRILDKSGRGNHATQATTTKRPVYSRRVNLLNKTVAGATWAAAIKTEIPNYFGEDVGFSLYQDGVSFGDSPSLNSSMSLPAGQKLTSSAIIDMATVWPGSSVNVGVLGFHVGGGVGYAHAALSSTGVVSIGASAATTEIEVSKTLLYGAVYQISVSARFTAALTSSRIYCEAVDLKTSVWGRPQLTYYTDSTLPYQRVNTAADYDADPAKFPAYLRFDGVDDAYQTNSIDFTGTDKMTVWAGVTKLSDAATGVLLELSVNSFANNGTFGMFTPSSAAGNNVFQRSRGTAQATTAAAAIAPTSFIWTAVSSINPPSIATRISGVQVSANTLSQGAGNYGNYPLYIGAGAGTASFFNGRLYSLIVRGAQSSQSQIEATELYVKRKMRLP